MTDNKMHTQGPWVVRHNEPWIIAKAYGDMKSVCHLNYPPKQTETQKANAHLIAAAPELLEALELFTKEYVEFVESGDAGFWDAEEEDKVIMARKTISKARGEL